MTGEHRTHTHTHTQKHSNCTFARSNSEKLYFWNQVNQIRHESCTQQIPQFMERWQKVINFIWRFRRCKFISTHNLFISVICVIFHLKGVFLEVKGKHVGGAGNKNEIAGSFRPGSLATPKKRGHNPSVSQSVIQSRLPPKPLQMKLCGFQLLIPDRQTDSLARSLSLSLSSFIRRGRNACTRKIASAQRTHIQPHSLQCSQSLSRAEYSLPNSKPISRSNFKLKKF